MDCWGMILKNDRPPSVKNVLPVPAFRRVRDSQAPSVATCGHSLDDSSLQQQFHFYSYMGHYSKEEISPAHANKRNGFWKLLGVMVHDKTHKSQWNGARVDVRYQLIHLGHPLF